MATLVLAAAGAAVGSAVGGAVLGVSAQVLGGFAGSLIGGQIDRTLFAGNQTVTGPRLDDLTVQSSAFGAPVALPYGTTRISGNVIWSSGLKETRQETESDVGGKGGGPTVTQVSFSYSASFAVGISARPIVDVGRIWADGKLLRDAAGRLAVGGDVRVHRGDESQLPDPLIEAVEGAGNVPAHRGLAYVVFEDLQLAEYANRIPNLTFEVIADPGGTAPLGAIVADLSARSGLETVETGELTSLVAGFVLARPGAARDAIESLMRVHGIDAAEVDGRVVFHPRPRPVSAVIGDAKLGARAGGAGREARLASRRAEEQDLPKEVVIRHIDPARDYQTGAQRARKLVTRTRGVDIVDAPIVLTATEAKQRAEERLNAAWAERETFRLSLMPEHAALAPGDVITVDAGGITRDMRLERTIFAGFLLCDAIGQGGAVFQSLASAESGGFAGQTVDVAGPTALELMNLPNLTATDAAAPVYYVAATGGSPAWRGAVLYVSRDGELSYSRLVSLGVPAVMGTVLLPPGPGPDAFWDEGARIRVQLASPAMALQSRGRLSVLDGQNAALVGDEIVLFRDAVQEADGSHMLSGLLRGRRGTEWAMAGHQAGERFVLLEPGSVAAIDTTTASIDRAFHYKPVSINRTLAETDARTFAYQGADLKPLAPVHLRARRDPDGRLTVSWRRRARFGGEWRDAVDVPLGEAAEAYDLDVMDGDAVVRTITTATPSAVYGPAEQIADFGAVQPSVAVRVCQISAAVGRGQPAQSIL